MGLPSTRMNSAVPEEAIRNGPVNRSGLKYAAVIAASRPSPAANALLTGVIITCPITTYKSMAAVPAIIVTVKMPSDLSFFRAPRAIDALVIPPIPKSI